jgi:poly(A) polymerase Pap1
MELADLVYKFFDVYAEWKWIDPIYIKVGKQRDKLSLGSLQVLDGLTFEFMPIMTPSKIPRNSSYRVC